LPVIDLKASAGNSSAWSGLVKLCRSWKAPVSRCCRAPPVADGPSSKKVAGRAVQRQTWELPLLSLRVSGWICIPGAFRACTWRIVELLPCFQGPQRHVSERCDQQHYVELHYDAARSRGVDIPPRPVLLQQVVHRAAWEC
jgi:hypothetical protein